MIVTIQSTASKPYDCELLQYPGNKPYDGEKQNEIKIKKQPTPEKLKNVCKRGYFQQKANVSYKKRLTIICLSLSKRV